MSESAAPSSNASNGAAAPPPLLSDFLRSMPVPSLSAPAMPTIRTLQDSDFRPVPVPSFFANLRASLGSAAPPGPDATDASASQGSASAATAGAFSSLSFATPVPTLAPAPSASGRSDDLYKLPPNLPVPQDDGACDHLRTGRFILPSIPLQATNSKTVDISKLKGTVVLYIYPKTGVPNKDVPRGWNEIPGARGCTPQSCAFRDHYLELKKHGADHVFGLSVQDTETQREVVERLHLPYPLLSDHERVFQKKLCLPWFECEGIRYTHRITLIICWGKIAHVMYPVFPTDANAGQVLEWLKRRENCEAAALAETSASASVLSSDSALPSTSSAHSLRSALASNTPSLSASSVGVESSHEGDIEEAKADKQFIDGLAKLVSDPLNSFLTSNPPPPPAYGLSKRAVPNENPLESIGVSQRKQTLKDMLKALEDDAADSVLSELARASLSAMETSEHSFATNRSNGPALPSVNGSQPLSSEAAPRQAVPSPSVNSPNQPSRLSSVEVPSAADALAAAKAAHQKSARLKKKKERQRQKKKLALENAGNSAASPSVQDQESPPLDEGEKSG